MKCNVKIDFPSKSKEDFVKSPLNYTGGKFKILTNIFELVPENVNTFIDLFGGGFNVGINAKASKIIYNDLNKYISEMFLYFSKYNFEEIKTQINQTIEKYSLTLTNVDGYNLLRKDYNANPSPLLLFVLTCYSFNHQIRFNNKHNFNTPFGRERSSYNESIEKNLEKFCYNLKKKNIYFYSEDFKFFKNYTYSNNDIVYCDPPYLITTGSYNDGKRGFKDWGEKEEKELLEYLDELNRKKIKFILSNVLYHKGKSNNLLIEWSKKYNVHYVKKDYKNCSYHGKNIDKETVEVLITNF